jgi:integrase
MADGVESRGKSIRIHFRLADGTHVKETWRDPSGRKIPDTVNNQLKAKHLRIVIQHEIETGTFDHLKHFPHSTNPAASGSGPTTFSAAVEEYLATKANLAPATYNQYTNCLAEWSRRIGSNRLMTQINRSQLYRIVESIKWKSPKSKKNSLIPLRGVFNLYFMNHSADANPMSKFQTKLPKKDPNPLSQRERDRVLEYMKQNYDVRISAYFTTAFFTGLRPEEIIAVRWSDIDEDFATLRIQRVRTFRGSERAGTKTGDERAVDLVAEAREAIKLMHPYTGGSMDNDIFQNPLTGRPWHDERAQRDTYWKPAMQGCGLSARGAYKTRHTFATVALMNGVNPSYIAAQLGHANSQLVHTTYSKWISKADGGAQLAKLEAALRTAASRPHHSPEIPQSLSAEQASQENSGRRDWTRTNDPHHVKVVL